MWVCVFVGGKQHVINQIVNQSTWQDSLKFVLGGSYVLRLSYFKRCLASCLYKSVMQQ